MLCFITLLVGCKVSATEMLYELMQWKQYALIGMLWNMSYLFILLSAPYLPNTIQVVLTQLQAVLIAYIDFNFVGIQLDRRKMTCIVLTIVFGLTGVAFSAETSSEPMV